MAAKKKKRQQTQLLITAGVMGLLVLAGGVVVWLSVAGGDPEPPPPAAADAPPPLPDATAVETPAAEPTAPATPPEPRFAEDNGRTLWAPPTGGGPLPLEHLPPGCEFLLSVRLAEMLGTADGRIVAEQFAPLLKPVAVALKPAGIRLKEVDRLTLALRLGERYGTIDSAIVVRSAAATLDGGSPARPKRVGRGALGVAAAVAGDTLVIAAPPLLEEIAELAGDPPPLRRELEELADAADADQHAVLLVAPSFLFNQGKPIFTGGVAALEEPLHDQLPDDLRGVLASLHWGPERFYWEVRGAAAAEITPTRLATLFDSQMSGWASDLQLALLDLSPDPHGRRVVANLPAMTRVAAEFARRGVEGRHAVLNGYLPPSAGHNLLLAAELMLAQQSAGVVGARATASAATTRPQTAAEKLRQQASVAFDRDTLEMALRYLSDEIDVPIVIRGGDLQLDGITKNQSFGLDERNKPAGEILVEILRRANPDKTATGPADTKQKLVYLIQAGDGGGETIFVTTRAAAAKRGDALPSVFGQ